MKQILVTVLISAMATMAIAADIPEQPILETASDAMAQQPENPSSFQLKINSLMDEERAAIEALEEEFANASSEATALQVLKQIEQVKLETELSLMEYQKDEAQKLGNTELVKKIEACMEQTRSPHLKGSPQDRPTPTER